MSLAQGLAAIGRWNDPQGNYYGVAANVSFNFSRGDWLAFTPAEEAAARDAMDLWSDVARINFFPDFNDPEILFRNWNGADEAAGTIGNTSNTGPAQFNPDDTHRVGLYVSSKHAMNRFQVGGLDRMAIMHEIGHGIGLDDTNGGSFAAAFPEDSQQYAIMSYRPETGTNGSSFGNAPGATNPLKPSTPLMYDIAAAQMFYGPNMTTRTGDTTYGFNATPDTRSAYQLGPSNMLGVFCIWDAWGNDTLDLSGYTASITQTINLAPGSFTSAGGLTNNISMADAVDVYGNNSWEAGFSSINIANYIENAIGGPGVDNIFGNEAGNRLEGRAGQDKLYGLGGADTLIGGSERDEEYGGPGGDKLYGDGGNDYLVGNTGKDEIHGGSEDDLLDGGSNGVADNEVDWMYGEAGNDRYFVSDRYDIVIETVGGVDREDRIYTPLNSFSLASSQVQGDVEILEFVGTGAFVGTGNGLQNTIIGGASGDTLNGGTGLDTLIGNGGDDLYQLFDAGAFGTCDTVVEAAGGGTDTVYVRVPNANATSYTLAPNVEYGVINDSTASGFTLKGNDLANKLYDDVGSNTLDGGANNDELNGGSGNDTLLGGADKDMLIGGAGNDTLDGGTGADGMRGGADSDTYVIDDAGDVISEMEWRGAIPADTGGVDTVQTTRSSYALPGENGLQGNFENLTYTGTGFFTGAGNGLANTITGGAYGNTLSGGGGQDVLVGGAKSDTLDGGAGGDRMIGGDGDDIYIVDDAGDSIEEVTFAWVFDGVNLGMSMTDSGGIDEVRTTRSSYTLPVASLDWFGGGNSGSIEKLTYTGTGNFIGTGNELANTITGGKGTDTLSGGKGDDTLIGGAGTDTLDGGENTDTVVLSGKRADYNFALNADGRTGWTKVTNGTTGEIDWIYAVETVKFADTTASLVSLLAAPQVIFGTESLDILRGNAQANTMRALGGADTLIGLGGADTLDGGAGIDTADYTASAAGVTVDLATGVATGGDATGDKLISIENITGSAFNDTLTGDQNVNVLDGGAGSDWMLGSGNDRLLGGAGDDFLYVRQGDTAMGGDGYDTLAASDTTIATGITIKVTQAMSIESLAGNNGKDVLDASAVTSSMLIVGYDGDDTVIGGSGEDYLVGDAYSFSPAGNDIMYGGAGSDHMYGYNGDDIMYGGGSNLAAGYGDRLWGGTGNDTLYGGGHGWVLGEEGNDTLTGGDYDLVMGGAGDDTVLGAAGFQQIIGGDGNDKLSGGAGGDRFDFGDHWGKDVITDFNFAQGDQIGLFDVSNLDSFSQLQIVNSGNGTDIHFGADTIHLDGIVASQVQASWFII